MQGLPSILFLIRNKFNKFNNTGTRMLDSIYHMPLKLIEPRHAIMCLREINYVMRYDVLKSDIIISRRA